MTDESPTGGSAEPEDPGDADVPDYAGELEHEHAGRATDAGPAAEAGAGPVDVRALLILVAIVVVVGAAILWVVLARGPASRPEAAATTEPVNAEADAAALYAKNCAGCHGPAGQGMPRGGAPALAGSGTTVQVAADRIVEGAPGMPAFRGRLTDVEIATLAAYVAAMGRTG